MLTTLTGYITQTNDKWQLNPYTKSDIIKTTLQIWKNLLHTIVEYTGYFMFLKTLVVESSLRV